MSLGPVDDAEFQAWANRVKGKIDSNFAKEQIGKSAKRIGVYALRQFKANTPVDTGTLRRGWTAEGPTYVGSWVVTLENNVEYASYVENGHRTSSHTSWVAGQFFMKKSLNEVDGKLSELITPGLWKLQGLLS